MAGCALSEKDEDAKYYSLLIDELRAHKCSASDEDTMEYCENNCSYNIYIEDESEPNGIRDVCVCGLMNRAADAIEKLTGIQKEKSENGGKEK